MRGFYTLYGADSKNGGNSVNLQIHPSKYASAGGTALRRFILLGLMCVPNLLHAQTVCEIKIAAGEPGLSAETLTDYARLASLAAGAATDWTVLRPSTGV